MSKDLRDGKSLSRVESDHTLNYLLRVLTQLDGECEISLENQLMQILKILSLEWHCPAQHRV